MDTLLEYLYVDVMKRCWEGSSSRKEAINELNQAEGKSWKEIYNAAQLLAEREGMTAFLAGFHLGLTLENTLWQRFDVLF